MLDAKLESVTSALGNFQTVIMAVCTNIQSIISEVKRQVDLTSSDIASVAQHVQEETNIYEARLKALEENLNQQDVSMVSQNARMMNHNAHIEKQIDRLIWMCGHEPSESIDLMTQLTSLNSHSESSGSGNAAPLEPPPQDVHPSTPTACRHSAVDEFDQPWPRSISADDSYWLAAVAPDEGNVVLQVVGDCLPFTSRTEWHEFETRFHTVNSHCRLQ